MVHLPALPGAPAAALPPGRIIEQAVAEARLLAQAGFDAIILENMHDRPYVHGPKGPETVAVMTAAAVAVRQALPGLPLGIQILSGGNAEALAVAHAAGFQFIRCENFVFAHVADEGLLSAAEAGPLLRYRRSLGAVPPTGLGGGGRAAGEGKSGAREAGGVRIFCDVKKKHASHAITADIGIAEAAEAAEFFGADGLVVTGVATGKPADLADVAAARGATGLPVLVGSGVTPESIPALFEHADALIVGSYLKKGGRWFNPPDPERCREIVAAARRSRR